MPSLTLSPEIDLTVNVEVTPGTPGKTYGDPYDCYPPEGPEVESWEVDLSPEQRAALAIAKLDAETAARVLACLLKAEIEAEIDDHIEELERGTLQDRRDARAEAAYEARREDR